GGIQKRDLLDLISQRETWFFGDSGFQLCVREPDREGYFAYDEHGLFFLYDLPHAAELLARMGFANRAAKLVSDGEHWELRPNDAEHELEDFKRALKLRSLFFSDEGDRLEPLPKPL